ncbi:MAG TPA: hypothetical protein PK264_22780, partial [Hyphomicrobiaceae bacterium]|nr:hypothetical protein [Hyphomicrobiaceae bacterium]
MSDSAWASHQQPELAATAPAERAATLAWVEPEGGLTTGAGRRILLGLSTGGISNAWTRVDLRRRTWNAIRIDGTPLVHTGTPR